MDIDAWFERYGLLAFLGSSLLLVLVAVLLWRPGSKPIAMGLAVLALLPGLSVLAVALDGVSTAKAER